MPAVNLPLGWHKYESANRMTNDGFRELFRFLKSEVGDVQLTNIPDDVFENVIHGVPSFLGTVQAGFVTFKDFVDVFGHILKQWDYVSLPKMDNVPKPTKRWSKMVYEMTGVKLNNQQLAKLGEIYSVYVAPEGISYDILIDEGVTGTSKEYKHVSSCWFNEYAVSIDNLIELNGGAIRFYKLGDKDKVGVSVFEPEVRVWWLPYADGFVLFNVYGMDELERCYNIISTLLGVETETMRVDFDIRSDFMYINNETALFVRSLQPDKRKIYSVNLDTGELRYRKKYRTYWCSHTDNRFYGSAKDRDKYFVSINDSLVWKPEAEKLPRCYFTNDYIVGSSHRRVTYALELEDGGIDIIEVKVSYSFYNNNCVVDSVSGQNVLRDQSTVITIDGGQYRVFVHAIADYIKTGKLRRCYITGKWVTPREAMIVDGKLISRDAFYKLENDVVRHGTAYYTRKLYNSSDLCGCPSCGNVTPSYVSDNFGGLCPSCGVSKELELGVTQPMLELWEAT